MKWRTIHLLVEDYASGSVEGTTMCLNGMAQIENYFQEKGIRPNHTFVRVKEDYNAADTLREIQDTSRSEWHEWLTAQITFRLEFQWG